MTFGFWDLIFAIILIVTTCGLLPLVGVIIGGLFVLRAKGSGYEPILPPLRDKDEGAINIDDIGSPMDNNETAVGMDDIVEKILQQRSEEDPNNPAKTANNRMKEQMNG